MKSAPPGTRLRGRLPPLLRLLVLLLMAASALCATADQVEANTETTLEKSINESDITNGIDSSDTLNITSVPDEPLQCSTQCSRAAGATLRFQPGRRYLYTYEAEGQALVDMFAADGPKLRIRATAALDALSDCRLRLHLVEAEVLESVLERPKATLLAPWTPSRPVRDQWRAREELGEELRRLPLSFAYDDGRVHALCPAADEPRWALNVKRGLLSALQSSGRAARSVPEPVLERDVSGLCLTSYYAQHTPSRGGKKVVQLFRFKDLATCAHRSHVVFPLPAGSLSPAAGARSPLQGEMKCEQSFEDGVLEEASCQEMQTLRPFSVEVTPTTALGATATASQTLRLKDTTAIPLGAEEALAVALGPRTTLQFEPEAEEDEEEMEEEAERAGIDAEEEALDLLKHLEAAAHAPASADPDAPALLRRLTAALRRADFPALERLFRRTQQPPVLRRLLLETLPGARSAAAAALLTHLAAAGGLAPDDVDAWLAARALRGAPSARELLAFAPLVTPTARARTLLAAGALVHAHCSAAPPGECARPRSAAADLAGRLERALGPRCRPRGPALTHASAEALLRALGNAGLLSARGADTLRACYQDAGNPLAVRLAAVDALRRVPCGAVDRQQLLRLFASPRADPELRIAAYLGAMRCPSVGVFQAVRDAMLREDLGQVSSFVWSHLRNIQTSALEWKSELAAFLEDSYLKEKFNTESLKYSRNYETSTFFESLDSGAAAEANVVFSPSSYLPRSGTVNLTVEVFGQPLNLLEVGARAEGFERVVEEAFGPGGFYPDATLRDLLANLRGAGGQEEAELENSLERLAGAHGGAGRLRDEPRAALYARVFGQEVAFSTLGDAPRLLRALRQSSPLGSLRDIAALLKDSSVDYTKAFTLDDAKYTVPTTIGLPLALSLRAGGLLRVRASLGVNASREGVRASAELAPSASLGAEASMLLGTRRAVRLGVRVRQRARALHFAGGDAHFAPGRRLHLTMRAPSTQLQLLEAESELLLVQGPKEVAAPPPLWPLLKLKHVGACSGATLERVLGLRACANATFMRGPPNRRMALPLFPLSGPASLRLALDKTDAFDRYELQYDLDADRDGVRGLKVRVDAPGSPVDRLVWLEGRVEREGPAFALALRSPAGGAEASVAVTRNASAAAADARLALGGAELLRVAAALRWEETPAHGLRLRPELEARAAGSRPVRLAGELGLQPGARYHANVVLRGTGEPVQLSGELLTRDGGYSVRGSVSCPLLNGSLSGNVTAGPGACASDLRLEYAAADGRQHSAAFSHRFLSGFGLLALNASSEMTEFPTATARLQWALLREDGLREHRLRWERAGRVWKSLQRLRMQRQGPRAHLQALAAFSCPQRRIDYKLDLEHQASEGNWSSRAEALLGWKQRYAAGVQLAQAPGPRVVLNAEAATPSVRATLAGRLLRRKHLLGELEGELYLPGGRSHKLALTGTYKHDEGSGGGGPQTHQVQLELRGVLRGQLRTHVALAPDGVEHALRVLAGDPAAQADPVYMHRLTYRMADAERHIVDGTVSIAGRNFSGSVEAIRSPSEHSTVVRLPFSSEIVITTKFFMTSPGLDTNDYDAFLLEVSWDKHLNPNNYVAFNSSFNGAYSRLLLEYPNQHIMGEIMSDPGFVSLNFGWAEDRKLQSEVRWILDSDEGTFSAWMNTPFRGMEKQKLFFNYTAVDEELIVHGSAACLGRRQSVSARARRRGAASLDAVFTAAGDLLPELHASLEHDPGAGGRTGFTALSGEAARVSLVATRRARDGRLATLEAEARGALLPLPECALSYAHPAHALTGSLLCRGVLQLHFDADTQRPKGNFSAWMPRLGHANFDFDAADSKNTAVFDTRDPSGERVLYVSLEHLQQGAHNFSLALDTQWNSRAVKANISSHTSAWQRRYTGVVSGDLQMSFTHASYYSGEYPGHFFTALTLPGQVSANHTFQGRDLLNWRSEVHVRSGEVTSNLHVDQVLNRTHLLHRTEAHCGGANAVARLSANFVDPSFPLEAALVAPTGAARLSLRLGDAPLLRLSYSDKVLQLSGRTELHDRNGLFSAEVLIPQIDPLNVSASYNLLDGNSLVKLAARWSNESLTAIAKQSLDLSGKHTATVDVQHSVAGELFHFDTEMQRTEKELSGYILGRVTGKEIQVDARTVKESRFGSVEEAFVLVRTYFSYPTNFSYSAQQGNDGVSVWKLGISKENKTRELVAKSKISRRYSMAGVSLMHAEGDRRETLASISGVYNGSDVANQTVEVIYQVDTDDQHNTSRLKAAFVQSDSRGLARGALWHALLVTPYKGMTHSEVMLNFTNVDGDQTLALALRRDAWRLQANGTCSFGARSSRVALAVQLPPSLPVRRLAASIDYRQQSPADHLVVSTVTCDDQVLETNVSVAASDGELAAILETRSSLHGYSPMSARFNVAGTLREGKSVLFVLQGAGGGRLDLAGQLTAPSALRVQGRLDARSTFGRTRWLDADLRYDLEGAEGGRRFASLAVNATSRIYLAEGEVVAGPRDRRRLDASLRVQLPGEGGLRASAQYDASERGALSASAGVATAAGRDLFRAALSLNDSILAAQVVSQPLGVHALSLAASWAARGPGRYARLHLHLPTHELSAEANATHDLLVSELLLSVSGNDVARLHAKYDVSVDRNVTAVVVRGNDTLTLSASLARTEGTHADLYLAAARLGRVHVAARLRTPEGSHVDLFIDDQNFDRVLHTSLAAKAKEIAVFTESQFKDLQKLNISIRFDVVPNFNHAGLDMEYITEQTKLPARLSAKIDRKSAFFKLNHFVHKLFPEDMEAIFTYDKLLDRPSNPSYVFVLSVNNTKIFRSSANFVFDWEKEIQIDLKMNSHLRDKKWKIGVGCRCETKFPATVNLNVTDQTGALVTMDGAAVAAARGGFTYRLALSTDYGRQKREAQVEYYPQNPLLMSVDTNATSGGETRHYLAALKLDLERAALRLELVTPVVGYENLTLNWRREGDAVALDAHTTYPGFERLGVRARFHLKEGPTKAASLYVEKDGSTMGGAMYLEQVEGLLNVSCELDMHGPGDEKSGLNFWYDVRGPTKSVEVKLLGTCVHRVAATFATEAGFELHAIADIKKQASTLDVSYGQKRVALRSVIVGKTVADFNFQRIDSGNNTSVDAKFTSSFVAHPLKLRYDYNIIEKTDPEIHVFMSVSALEKTSTVDFRMPADDSPNLAYNVKVTLPDGEWIAELNMPQGGNVQAKTIVTGFDVEVLHAELHEPSRGVGTMTISVLDGQFVDAKLTYDVAAIKKILDLKVVRDGSPVLSAHLHLQALQESMEVKGTVDAPKLHLRGVAFNYTLGRGQFLRNIYTDEITDDAAVGHWFYFVWQTESERMATDLHAVIGSQTLLDVSVKDGKSHLFSYKLKLYSLQQESPGTQLDMTLRLKEREWKFFCMSTYRENYISEIRFDTTTPWSQLQRVVFNIHTNDAFDMKLLVTTHNKDALLLAKLISQNGMYASAELSVPERPRIGVVFNATGGISPAVYLEITSGNVVMRAEAGITPQDGDRVDAHARLTSPWSAPLALEGTYEPGVARVRTLRGTRIIAEGVGKIDIKYDRDMLFNLALEGAMGHKKVRAAAGWSYPTEGDFVERKAHLEWESEGAVIKFRFGAARDGLTDRRGREFSSSLSVVADSIVLHGWAGGTWPMAVKVTVRRGDMQEAYEASYDFNSEGHSTNGSIVLKTTFSDIWQPLEIKVRLERDPLTDSHEAVLSSRGYHMLVSYRKNLFSDARFDLSGPNGLILALKSVVTDGGYDAEVSWSENFAPKKVELSLNFDQKGKLEIRTPWNMYALANWNIENSPSGQALLHWSGMDLNLEFDMTPFNSNAFFSSPWGSVRLMQVSGGDRGSVAIMVDDSTTQKQILYSKWEYDGMENRFVLHLWRAELHKVEALVGAGLRRVALLVDTPALRVDGGVELDAERWEARLSTGGRLAPPVDARLSSYATLFAADASLPGMRLSARVARLQTAEVEFSFAGGPLRANLSARGGAEAKLSAWARAEDVGEARLDAVRDAAGAQLGAECTPAGGRRLAAHAAARWGHGNFSLEAAAGGASAGLALGARPRHLHLHLGNATLLVRDGLALVQAPDGSRHSLEWRVQRGDGRLTAHVQLECAVLLAERAELYLQLGPSDDPDTDGDDDGGVGAEVRLTCGGHRHAVVLRFRGAPRSALEVRVDADGATLLALNSSLAVADERVDAALHLRFRDTDNTLQVTHRLAFPVHSSLEARSPLLLAAERVAARLVADGKHLEAEASRGEGGARRFVALRASYDPRRRAASLHFDSSAFAHVRSFALGGALHLADLGFNANAQLATADGAGVVLHANAALAADDLKADVGIYTRSVAEDKKYFAALSVPLRFAADVPQTPLVARLELPGAKYLLQAEVENAESAVTAWAVARAPGFESRADLSLRRKPAFALALKVEVPVKGFEHLRLSVNEPVEHSDAVAHYLEWGTSRVELRHRFLLKERLIVSEVQLTTPFQGHERYAMNVAYQNGEQKLVVARVTYPGLERDLGLELDYRVRGLFNTSLRAAFNAPFLPRLRSATIALTHVLDKQVSGVYLAALEGEVNGYTAGVNLSVETGAKDNASPFRASLELERDGQRAWLRAHGDVSPYDGQDAFVSIDISSFRVDVRYGPHKLLTSVNLNGTKLLELNATASSQLVAVTCTSPLKTLFLQLRRKREAVVSSEHIKTDVVSSGLELGWDEEGELKTRVGMGVTARISRTREEFLSFFVVPGRSVRTTYVVEESERAWERTLALGWGANSTLGYTMVARRPLPGVREGLLRVDLPARAFEASVSHVARGAEVRQSAAVLWDAARDRRRRLGYELRCGEADGLTLTLLHPLLGEGARVGVRGRLNVRDERLQAAFDVKLALLNDPGLDWRAGADFDLRRRAGGGGRALVVLQLADRGLGREARAALDAALDAEQGAGLLLNVSYTPQATHATEVMVKQAPVTEVLVTEVRAAPALLLLRARAPGAALEMSARAWENGVELLARVDDSDAVRAQVEVEERRMVAAVLELGGGLRYSARAGAPHRRRLSAELWVEAAGGERLPAARAAVELTTPRLITARAHWRPNTFAEVWPLVQQELERVAPAASAAAEAHARLWQTRWASQGAAWPQGAAWRDFALRELGAVRRDALALANDWAGLCAEAQRLLGAATEGPAGAFWSGVRAWAAAAGSAVEEWARATLEAAFEVGLVVMDTLKIDAVMPALGDAIAAFKEHAVALQAATLQRAGALLEATGGALKAAGAHARAAAARAHERVVRPAAQLALEATDALAHAFFELDQRFTELAKVIVDSIMEVKELRAIKDLTVETVMWLQGPFHQILERVFETVFEVAQLVLNDLQESLRLLWERAQQVAPSLPPAVAELYQQMLWILENYVLTPRMLQALNEWSRESTSAAAAGAHHPGLTYRPERGEVVLVQPLPVDWEAFDIAPRFDQLRQLAPAGGGGGGGGDDRDDTKERLLATLKELTAQPPRALAQRALSHAAPSFSAVGQLLGARHVVTFDGNAYTLRQPARCSYLLAGDLVGHSFAVLVHFNGQGSSEVNRTFTVLTPHHSVHVSEAYAVRVNGQPVDAPTRASPFLAVRRSEQALAVAAPGFELRCRVDRHVCSVRVSGWLFSRVRGLLGSFDRERARDLEAEEAVEVGGVGAATNKGEEGPEAWRVGRCRAGDGLRTAPATAPRAGDSPACKQVFEARSSPLSECFARVEPAPYAALCAAVGPCDAALAYKEACELRTWFRPSAPPECESCRGADGAWMGAGTSSARDARAAPAADVVLVVQAGCAKGRLAADRLSEVAPKLEFALLQRGVPDARFAVLSYGGHGARAAGDAPAWLAAYLGEAWGAADAAPRLHTSGGRVWADAQATQKTLHRLLHGLSETDIPERQMTAALQAQILQSQASYAAGRRAGAGEAERAVAAGAGLRARAGAGRAVVLLQCDACERDGVERLAAALAAGGGGVSLHVLRPAVLTPGPGRKTADVIGVDGQGFVFRPTDNLRALPRPVTTRAAAQRAVAKDACTAAALQSGGSVFDAARAADPFGQGGRFVGTWAAYVERSARHSAPCQRMRCAPGGHALCAAEDVVPQNSEEADEQFLQFLQ